MSITALLYNAQSGLIAQKVAIEVTGENVANVNTEGYSRQRVILETAPTVTANGFPLGTGVRVAQVQRNYDDMLQTLLKNENSTNGQSSVELTNMQSIEQLFPDLTDDGLGSLIQNYFDAWEDLSVNAQGTPERQAVLSSGQLLADNIRQINSYLNDIKTAANKSLEGLTSDINDKLKNIAYLNVQIQQTETVSGNANELRDQRDLLVRELAEKVGVNYNEEANSNLTITLASGEVLVSGSQYGAFSLQDNSGTYDIYLTEAGGAAPALIDMSAAKGEIGGTLNVRDNIVDGYIGKLDELAYNIATQVNSIHQAGYGLDNSTGNNFFTPPGTMSGYSAIIDVAVTSTDQVAAADADVTTNGKGNNANALDLAALANTAIASSQGDMTLSAYYNALVGSVGVGVQTAQRTKDLSDSVLTQLNNLRESQSGVSLDEEMTNLIKYQKAFEGSARMITAASEMMDTILNMVR